MIAMSCIFTAVWRGKSKGPVTSLSVVVVVVVVSVSVAVAVAARVEELAVVVELRLVPLPPESSRKWDTTTPGRPAGGLSVMGFGVAPASRSSLTISASLRTTAIARGVSSRRLYGRLTKSADGGGDASRIPSATFLSRIHMAWCKLGAAGGAPASAAAPASASAAASWGVRRQRDRSDRTTDARRARFRPEAILGGARHERRDSFLQACL